MDTGPAAGAGAAANPAGACSPHLAAAASILHNFLLLQQQQQQNGAPAFGPMSEPQKLSSPTGSTFAPSATLSPAQSHPPPAEAAAAFGPLFAAAHSADVHNQKQDAAVQQLQQELKSEKEPRAGASGWHAAADECYGRPQSLGCLGWLAAVGEGHAGALSAPLESVRGGAARNSGAEPVASVDSAPGASRNRSNERLGTAQSAAVVRPWSNSPIGGTHPSTPHMASATATATATRPPDGASAQKRAAQQPGVSEYSRHKISRRNNGDSSAATVRAAPQRLAALVESGTQTSPQDVAAGGGQELLAMENMCAKLQDLFNRTLQQLRILEQRRIFQKCMNTVL